MSFVFQCISVTTSSDSSWRQLSVHTADTLAKTRISGILGSHPVGNYHTSMAYPHELLEVENERPLSRDNLYKNHMVNSATLAVNYIVVSTSSHLGYVLCGSSNEILGMFTT